MYKKYDFYKKENRRGFNLWKFRIELENSDFSKKDKRIYITALILKNFTFISIAIFVIICFFNF